MKYSEKNKPIVCMMTQSTCYKGTKPMEVKGVLWHSTGANNPTLKRYVQPDDDAPDRQEMLNLIGINKYNNDMNHIYRQMGMNCWIGKLADGTVSTLQVMPWEYRPWGCGSGPKGSCNDGWIQFEICEDGLTDKNYFNQIYAEACEITAYLCDMFDIDPHGTVVHNGVTVPTILCHKDSYDLGLGCGHADVMHWFPTFGKDMDDVRNDVAKLLPKKQSTTTQQATATLGQIYRIREAWDKPATQKGAYRSLESAIDLCKSVGSNYKVFDESGKVIYPEAKVESGLKVGDEIKLSADAKYVSGNKVPNWVINSKLYLRQILKNGNYVISTLKTGAITGQVPAKYVTAVEQPKEEKKAMDPYLVKVTAATLNVRKDPNSTSKITTQIKRNQVYTIVDENNGWGKLKSGAGWIDLSYVQKVTVVAKAKN